MIRVIIAEDHHLVRQGIRALLEQSGEVEVIAEAATGQEAVEMTEALKPDVVIMDLSMPRLDGMQAAERILDLNLPTQVVILSIHSDTTMVQQLLRRGVRGYLLKDAVSGELMLAIRSVSDGKMYLSPTISDTVRTMLLSPADPSAESVADLLTPREREVLQLVAEGNTNSAIADTLSISVKTVEKHRANVMSKLQVNDLASLIREAIKHGLIFLDT
ncbi:MAG: response regulator transcription factor [Ardenticatenaceae bacterium]|nr:response regulator transcription factor [Anaerolineales bacterium]MCB8983500.1 response regulator transcription factor [Ardenticatenaceae bacterium]